MNKQTISIPEGIFYLTDDPSLSGKLPDCSYILNKVMTGCGATTFFLLDNKATVLSVPRRELAFCKANSSLFKGKVHLFGSCSYETKKDTSTVVDKINDMKSYINTSSQMPKIIVTYDSTKHVIQGLRELGCLQCFRFVVDEFQTIFTDAAFRGDVEVEFMENLNNTGSQVVFLSATPYLEDYLDELDEFKSLSYIELEWPKSSTHMTHIKSQKYDNGSPKTTIDNIINHYKSQGYFEETMDKSGIIRRSTQAVFFVNHVKFIINTIKRNGLLPNEVNIICSSANDNDKKLKEAKLKFGHAPKEGEQHCPYTFVTKAAYEGVDFYSPCAYTYIFSDINMKNLAVDISLDIAQIMGRQRLEQNIFKYSATFFYKTTIGYTNEEEKEFMDHVKQKAIDTQEAVNDFEACQNIRKRNRDARKYKTSQEREKYVNDYISVVDDKITNQPKMVFNNYVMINEIRAWRVQQEQYLNGTLVMGSINNTFQSANSDKVTQFLRDFKGTFEEKMKYYAEFLESCPECKSDLQGVVSIPITIKTYYNALGIDRLRNLSWKEAAIKAAIKSPGSIEDRIEQTFTESWYSNEDIKKKLQDIYDDCCPGFTAKATDLRKYLECREKKETIDGKRVNGYRIKREINNKL
jgi:hypothetical protein